MLLTLILFYFGPPILLVILGGVSIYLATSGYMPTYPYIGWAVVVTSLVICLATATGQASAEISYSSIGTVFYLLFLGMLLIPQGFLMITLLSEVLIPDPSKGLKVIKTHAVAEKKALEDDLPGAIAEYEKAIADDPKDFPARFRLAELYCENKEYDKGAMAYEALLAHGKKLAVDEHCSALTRLSEIYVLHLNDVESARKHIQTIMKEYPDTKYARYAEEHLANL